MPSQDDDALEARKLELRKNLHWWAERAATFGIKLADAIASGNAEAKEAAAAECRRVMGRLEAARNAALAGGAV
jgi:hypothetical protein